MHIVLCYFVIASLAVFGCMMNKYLHFGLITVIILVISKAV